MPSNLIFIVCFQVAIWTIVRLLPHSSQLDKTQWMMIAVIGFLLGITMDLVLGAFGIFAYLPNGPQSSAVQPHNLEVYLLLFNAFFSYGLAVATLALVANSMTADTERSIFWLYIIGFAIFAGILGIIFLPKASIASLFSWGVMIVSSGEFLLMLNNRSGPIITMISQISPTSFLRLWVFSIVVGASYELANLFFPFWIWLPHSDIPATLVRMLIIFLGYFALFHAITTLWVLFNSKKKKWSENQN